MAYGQFAPRRIGPRRDRLRSAAGTAVKRQFTSSGDIFLSTIQDLKTKRDSLLNTYRSILDTATTEGRALNPNEQKDLEGIQAKVDGFTATIRAHETIEELREESEKTYDP